MVHQMLAKRDPRGQQPRGRRDKETRRATAPGAWLRAGRITHHASRINKYKAAQEGRYLAGCATSSASASEWPWGAAIECDRWARWGKVALKFSSSSSFGFACEDLRAG